MTADEYFRIGERILSLRKAFNMREGITHKNQLLENRASGRLSFKTGPTSSEVYASDKWQDWAKKVYRDKIGLE